MDNIPVFKFALRKDLANEKQFLPTRAEPLATGWDVRAAQEDRKPIVLRAGQYFKITLGFRSFCPAGFWYQLAPRSSSFTKKHMHNLIGTIDETWEGETCFAGQYVPDLNMLGKDLIVNFGDPIAQIIPMKRQEMLIEEASNETIEELYANRNAIRKDGGFGSTDRK
jgi:dUTPase